MPSWPARPRRPAASSPSSAAASCPSRCATPRAAAGRNQEYALALAIALDGLPGVAALAADTDGIDGGEGRADDPAGATIDATTLSAQGASSGRSDAQMFLDNNDATAFFEAAGGLIVRGPTHTNVNDFRVILVDP